MTRACASMAKSSVMLTLIPSAIRRRTALEPSVVPGTLIMTFGRSTAFHKRCASSTVAVASFAAPGDTSIET